MEKKKKYSSLLFPLFNGFVRHGDFLRNQNTYGIIIIIPYINKFDASRDKLINEIREVALIGLNSHVDQNNVKIQFNCIVITQ